MRASRLTISGAMLAIVAIGLGLPALASPSVTAAYVTFGAAIASLGLAALGAILTRGWRRMGIGCLAFAGAYFATCFGPWLSEAFAAGLLTSRWCDIHYEQLSYTPTVDGEEVWVRLAVGQYEQGTWDQDKSHGDSFRVRGTTRWASPRDLRVFGPETMHRIGHSLATVVLGLLGAGVAGVIAGRMEHPPPPTIGVDRPIDAGL